MAHEIDDRPSIAFGTRRISIRNNFAGLIALRASRKP